MTELYFPSEYFSPAATLDCGQIFRFSLLPDGKYLVLSADKACLLFQRDNQTCICSEDADYFENFFDCKTNYGEIVKAAHQIGNPYLTAAANFSKGIRILRQDRAECLISFIISQQNNIPRIKGLLSRLTEALGEKKSFAGYEYRTFPTLSALAEKDEAFYRELGFGYRAKYIPEAARKALSEGFSDLEQKCGRELKTALTAYMGVGNKVADCAALFAFHDAAACPIDTWMEKLYHENFGGKERDREKINKFFTDRFKEYAGIFQQYLFYYKRTENRTPFP